jgi:hypothetical protein
MGELAAERILTGWEAAASHRAHRRALALLELADGGSADMALGRRDAMLLRVFRDIRGPELDALAECPQCCVTLELKLQIDELCTGYDERREPAAAFEVDLGTAAVQARCPTTEDLIAVSTAPGPAAARRLLVARCVSSVRRDHEGSPQLSDDEIDRLGDELERIDPLVDVRIEIGCEECSHRWSALLDVPLLVWAQVEGMARRLLRQVDALALRYGWSEAEILAISEARRLAYLDLA